MSPRLAGQPSICSRATRVILHAEFGFGIEFREEGGRAHAHHHHLAQGIEARALVIFPHVGAARRRKAPAPARTNGGRAQA